MEPVILTPYNDPWFYSTLRGVIPVDFTPNQNLILDSDSGILRTMDSKQAREYLFGGQYYEDEELGIFEDG